MLNHRDLSQAFLCGTSLQDLQAQEVFQKTGLLHLIVVSGGHLQIISFLILFLIPRRQRKHKWLSLLLWILLFGYCFATGFQAPVVRAFFSRGLSSLNRHFAWSWDNGKCQLFSGVLLLLLFPEWILSFSFYLSWLASLGFLLLPLCYRAEKFSENSKILQLFLPGLLIQTLMAVFFGQFSLLGLFMNALVAPSLGLLLLPLSSLGALIPSLCPVIDGTWDLILRILTWVGQLSNSSAYLNENAFQVSTSRWIGLWIFLASTHCFFEILHQERYRKSHV
jgi:competence protein ComEC